jgi:hypothetical protein
MILVFVGCKRKQSEAYVLNCNDSICKVSDSIFLYNLGCNKDTLFFLEVFKKHNIDSINYGILVNNKLVKYKFLDTLRLGISLKFYAPDLNSDFRKDILVKSFDNVNWFHVYIKKMDDEFNKRFSIKAKKIFQIKNENYIFSIDEYNDIANSSLYEISNTVSKKESLRLSFSEDSVFFNDLKISYRVESYDPSNIEEDIGKIWGRYLKLKKNIKIQELGSGSD